VETVGVFAEDSLEEAHLIVVYYAEAAVLTVEYTQLDGWQLSGRSATKSRPPGPQYATVEAYFQSPKC